jgi:hypothetical protein
MLAKKSEPQIDIELQDSLGRVQFTNVSCRQLALLHKMYKIQELVKELPNDANLGREIRKLVVGQ